MSADLLTPWAPSAQQSAATVNASSVQKTNMANTILALMARGGSIDAATAKALHLPASLVGTAAAVLPYYMGDIEKNAGLAAGSMTQAIQQLQGSPAYQSGQYQAVFQQFAPAFAANAKTANDLASGATTNQMISEAQPVFGARMDVATGKRNSDLEQLKATLNNIDSIQAKKGFSGDSTSNQMVKFNARRAIAGDASGAISNAKLQNAMDTAGLQQQGRNLQLQNINLPDTLATAAASRVGAPGRNMAADYNTSLSPLNFFKISGQFPAQNGTLTSPGPSLLQQSLTSGESAVNSWLKNRNASTPGTSTGTGSADSVASQTAGADAAAAADGTADYGALDSGGSYVPTE